MSRNVFENNEPDITPEEVELLGDDVVVILPENQPGTHYSFHALSDGRVAVIGTKDGS